MVFDPSRLRTEDEWKRSGEFVFDAPVADANDPGAIVTLTLIADPTWYKQVGIPITRDGIMPFARYIIHKEGVVGVGNLSCGMCHTRVMPDGSVVRGAQGNFPFERTSVFGPKSQQGTHEDIRLAARRRAGWRFRYGTPWLNPDLFVQFDRLGLAEMIAVEDAIPPGVSARQGTSIFSPAQIPDLIGVKERKYLDHTGLVRHRSIGDLMRYAALNQGAGGFSNYGGFVPLKADSRAEGARRLRPRYSDEQLYALALYVYSLRPPKNPNRPNALSRRGEEVFAREGCGGCHPPPLCTNNRFTPALGFEIPSDHLARFDILPVSVGTDPELILRTRRGTGYYKVPSLKGVWYRSPFEHNGSIATLEDWFAAARLGADYVPTGWKGHGAKARAVKGHEFGLKLSPADKDALIAF